MAEDLARIYGTEQDRVNCPFYFKMGACRHGDRCSRQHNKPTSSQTVLIGNMYQTRQQHAKLNSTMPPPEDPVKEQQHFEDFFEDVFEELIKFGIVEDINVCENACDHLAGNVYVVYQDEDAAARCVENLVGRWYEAELSPVTDFREARCRQFEEDRCTRAGYCNFMHLFKPNAELKKLMFASQKGYKGLYKDTGVARGGGGGGGGRDRDRDRGGYRDRR